MVNSPNSSMKKMNNGNNTNHRSRRYSENIKLKALNLYSREMSTTTISRKLGIPESTIRTWAKNVYSTTRRRSSLTSRSSDRLRNSSNSISSDGNCSLNDSKISDVKSASFDSTNILQDYHVPQNRRASMPFYATVPDQMDHQPAFENQATFFSAYSVENQSDKSTTMENNKTCECIEISSDEDDRPSQSKDSIEKQTKLNESTEEKFVYRVQPKRRGRRGSRSRLIDNRDEKVSSETIKVLQTREEKVPTLDEAILYGIKFQKFIENFSHPAISMHRVNEFKKMLTSLNENR